MTAIYLKNDREIEGFYNAGKHAEDILKKIIYHAQPGWKPIELNEIAIEECKKREIKPAFLGYKGFPSAICFSKGNVMVHGIPDSEPLKKGDLVTIDFGTDIDGFIGDTAKTFVVGTTFGDYGKLISECRFSLYKAIKASKSGNKLSDVSNEISKIAKINKYLVPENYGGHGIDRHKMHSGPFVPNTPDYVNDFVLREGMIFAIEPMFINASSNRVRVADDGWSVIAGGPTAHCEHTILVGKDEGISLTGSCDNFVLKV